MKEEQAEITLGGQTFPVFALTFDQLQAVIPILADLGEPTLSLIERNERARQVIAIALDKPPEEVGAFKMRLPEIYDAVTVINRITGLVEMGERMRERRTPPAGPSAG